MPMPPVPFPPFAPDLSSLTGLTTDTAFNVVPQADGYGPFPSLQSFTQALPARNRGYFFARKSDDSIAVFAGTIDRVYLLDNSTFTWIDVSKGGVAYGALTPKSHWTFAQFNDFVIVAQVNTPPQKYTLSVGGVLADLGGSPPQAGHVSIINRFVVLTGLLTNPRRVQWSDLDAPQTWTAGVGLADFQDLPDGGSVFGTSGGDAYGLIFQSDCVRSLTYAPGSPTVFQIARIAANETLFAEFSPINAGDYTFYCAASGFKMVRAGGKPVAIGKELVDRFFFKDVDRGNLQLVIGATDPTHTRVYWAYKSQSGLNELFDKMLVFDYGFEPGRWALINGVAGEYLASLAKPGLTLELLDAIAPTPLDVVGAANNGAGLIRLTLNATSNSDFSIAGQNFIRVYDVTGTVEANGTWSVNIIDATHIDLIGSAFVHAYTGGGHIGGSLDALDFSLDSVAKSATAALSACDMDHKLGFFNGDNLEATLITAEQEAQGDCMFISGMRPMTDAPGAACTLGVRFGPQDAVVWGDEAIIDDTGFCGNMAEGRYLRGRLRIPAATEWTYARSMQAEAQPAGEE